MIASPLEGTPEVINAWANIDPSILTGDISPQLANVLNEVFGFLTLTVSPLQRLICNYPSIYELFPTRYYVSAGEGQYPYLRHIVIDNNIINDDTISEVTHNSYDECMQVISDFLPFYNWDLMESAKEFHDNCRINNKHITTVVTECLYLRKKTMLTTTGLDCIETINPIGKNYEVIPQETQNGDGLVPWWSATAGREGDFVIDCTKEGGHSKMINDYLENIICFLKGKKIQ